MYVTGSAGLALTMPQASPASFGDMDLGEGAVLHDNPLGGAWHDNPLGGSALSSPSATPRPPRLILPEEAATEIAPSPLVIPSIKPACSFSVFESSVPGWATHSLTWWLPATL